MRYVTFSELFQYTLVLMSKVTNVATAVAFIRYHIFTEENSRPGPGKS